MSPPNLMARSIPTQLSSDRVNSLLSQVGKPSLAEIAEAISGVYVGDELMILGGSLGLGLGNEKSDIDVLLVNPGSAKRSQGPFQFFVDGERIEVVRVCLTQLRSMAARLSHALTRGERIGLPPNDLRLLCRVAYGCRIAGPDLDADVGTALARTCHLAMIARSGESACQHALVAVLAREQEDDLIAAWNARGAVEAIAQREVLRSGAPYAGSKWVTEQLAARECGAALWPFLQLPADGDRRAYLADCLAMIADSLGRPATAPGLGEHARWDTGGLRHYQLRASGVLVQHAHNAVVELSPDESLAWDELDAHGERPIGRENRPARDLAWHLYIRGLAGIRWMRGDGQ